ncbi:MAG: two component transcriptional regulator, LuxR family [Verrucomicrobia bacterium]|nr:two component transcriptional regulator, LuxR family [Verrucomicrobiota bacterium]
MPVPPSSAYTTSVPIAEGALWVRRVVVGQSGRTYAEALQHFCETAFPNAKVVVAVTGAEVLSTLYTQHADVLLLAMILPDMHGTDLLPRIASEKLAARVLVAAYHHDERSLLALRDAQFDGLLDTKTETTDTLIKALQMVAAGRAFVSPGFRDTVIDRDPVGVVWQKLTPAEIRVFAVIGDGSGNEESARELGLSEATVQTHRRNLMHKLGISSSAKLVREAIRLGVVRITSDGTVIRIGLQQAPVHGAR